MVRRLIVYTILFSMALHCGCRLGFLDQLYQKRNEIAFTIGVMTQMPISICSSNYDFGKRLKVGTHESEHSSVPQSIIHIREINLFFYSAYQLPRPQGMILFDESIVSPPDRYKLSMSNSIFHPPSVLG